MPLARTPIENLPDAVKRAVNGPAPLKLMAARGLAPLKPAEMTVALYMLALDADAAVKTAAEKTAAELPEKILGPGLTDAQIDPRVLDFFAPRTIGKPALVEAVLLSRQTADETVAELVAKLGEMELEMVGQNEQRLLRCPAIIGALYMNARARMSTVDRAIELAVRNDLTPPNIPNWEDLKAAVLGTRNQPKPTAEQMDKAFAVVAAVGIGETEAAIRTLADDDLEIKPAMSATDKKAEGEEEEKRYDEMTIPMKIRMATLGNAFARGQCIRDSNKMVALAAIRSPGMTDNEVIKYSANRALTDEVIREIASDKGWTKLYSVKMNLVNNPKCPLPTSMRLLPFLHEKDLKLLAKSKGVPSALVAQAKKLLSTKGSS